MSFEEHLKFQIEQGWPRSAKTGTRSETDRDGFSREVEFEPGHPLTRGTSPATNYGRSTLSVRFLLHGPKGSVQFVWSTGITPEKTNREGIGFSFSQWMHHAPSGRDLGYHSDIPQYEGQWSSECGYRPNGVCFYDGSGLAGDDMLEVFLTEGEDAMWSGLYKYYVELFGTRRAPEV